MKKEKLSVAQKELDGANSIKSIKIGFQMWMMKIVLYV